MSRYINLSQQRKKDILDFLTTVKIQPVKKMRSVAKYDRDNSVIYINESVVQTLPDLLYVVAHEVAHEVWDTDSEYFCDEVALRLANQKFFREYIKNIFPQIYDYFTSRKSGGSSKLR